MRNDSSQEKKDTPQVFRGGIAKLNKMQEFFDEPEKESIGIAESHAETKK